MQSRIRCVASWLVVSLMCMGTAGHAALARSSSPEPSRAFRTPSAGILLLVVQNFVPIVGELIAVDLGLAPSRAGHEEIGIVPGLKSASGEITWTYCRQAVEVTPPPQLGRCLMELLLSHGPSGS